MSSVDRELADNVGPRKVRGRVERYHGAKWALVTDSVELDGGVVVDRDVVVHPGAVGIVALDDDECVVLVRQYRHAVGAELWELPAGLLDETGEDPLDCAKRELFEEAHLRANSWDLLIDLYSSPGMSSEVIRIFLARDLHEVAEQERHEQIDEERDMPSVRVALDAACDLAIRGRIHNAMAVAGLLVTERARASGWTRLRSVADPLRKPRESR